MAEGEGFEPSVACATSVFKTGALNQTLPPLRVGVSFERENAFCKKKRMESLNFLALADVSQKSLGAVFDEVGDEFEASITAVVGVWDF